MLQYIFKTKFFSIVILTKIPVKISLIEYNPKKNPHRLPSGKLQTFSL